MAGRTHGSWDKALLYLKAQRHPLPARVGLGHFPCGCNCLFIPPRSPALNLHLSLLQVSSTWSPAIPSVPQKLGSDRAGNEECAMGRGCAQHSASLGTDSSWSSHQHTSLRPHSAYTTCPTKAGEILHFSRLLVMPGLSHLRSKSSLVICQDIKVFRQST